MNPLPDNIIIRGILENRSRVIHEVYKECFPMIERMIINTGGNHDMARDIFQESLIIIYRKVSQGKLELHCKFSTYIYAVAKRLWFQERRKIHSRLNHRNDFQEVAEEPEIPEYKNRSPVKELFFKHFEQLSKDCQKILIMHFNKARIEDIQREMNYSNPHYTMDRKYRCKKSLIQRILNDPNFKSIQNEYSEHIRTLF